MLVFKFRDLRSCHSYRVSCRLGSGGPDTNCKKITALQKLAEHNLHHQVSSTQTVKLSEHNLQHSVLIYSYSHYFYLNDRDNFSVKCLRRWMYYGNHFCIISPPVCLPFTLPVCLPRQFTYMKLCLLNHDCH